ncbi:Hint domain-containing protein [Oceaniglobus trochenteri]|uniref:Hint domain-containing protein n=1 Tax=Oceaniglobus trochenteri TaxID=2763260 RepID=UPI001CFF69A7|nr:Hint domain-containing protein [Oceaniglobus trochenteri]
MTGFSGATRILTMEGLIAIDCLQPGDRIITRDAGMVRLVGVDSRFHRDCGPVILMPRALGHSRPDRPMILGADQPILLRDWRARGIYGRDAVLVPAGRLADGRHVCRADAQPRLRLFRLLFDAQHVIYAEGVECAVAPRVAKASPFSHQGRSAG